MQEEESRAEQSTAEEQKNQADIPGAEYEAHGKKPDLLPGQTPQRLRSQGSVRRINNIPLMIVVGATGLFCLVMCYTVLGRAGRADSHEDESAKSGDSATALAAQIVSKQAGKPTRKSVFVQQDTAVPPQVPKARSVTALPKPSLAAAPVVMRNPVLDRIRQKKLQLLEEAILGATRVRGVEGVSSSAAGQSPKVALRTEIERVQQEIQSLQNGGNVAGFAAALAQARQQLALLQMRAAMQVTGDSNAFNIDVNSASRLDRGATGAISSLQAPRTKHILRTGSVIPATLIGGINSDLPGQIIGQVSQNVYDSPTGNHLLIPQGSRLVGEYTSQVKYGQSRVFAVWQRIVFPDGKAMDLGAFPAATGAGYAGMKDKVDNHYIRIFGSAIMLSGIVAGIEYTQNQQNSGDDDSNKQRMGDTMSEALGQTLGQTMVEMIRKNMDIAPTLQIRPGFRLNIMLVKDLEFSTPYHAFDWRGNQ